MSELRHGGGLTRGLMRQTYRRQAYWVQGWPVRSDNPARRA